MTVVGPVAPSRNTTKIFPPCPPLKFVNLAHYCPRQERGSKVNLLSIQRMRIMGVQTAISRSALPHPWMMGTRPRPFLRLKPLYHPKNSRLHLGQLPHGISARKRSKVTLSVMTPIPCFKSASHLFLRHLCRLLRFREYLRLHFLGSGLKRPCNCPQSGLPVVLWIAISVAAGTEEAMQPPSFHRLQLRVYIILQINLHRQIRMPSRPARQCRATRTSENSLSPKTRPKNPPENLPKNP